METNDFENSSTTGSPWKAKKKEKRERLLKKLAKCRLVHQRRREERKQAMKAALLDIKHDQDQLKPSLPLKSSEVPIRKAKDSVDVPPNSVVQELKDLKDSLTECQAELSRIQAENKEIGEEVERLKRDLIDNQERVRQLRDVMARLRFGKVSNVAG